jgi:hypothetical protein
MPTPGTRVRAELGIGDDEVVVGLVGRLVREKGYREVFEAAPPCVLAIRTCGS